jgi:hypothetical protein
MTHVIAEVGEPFCGYLDDVRAIMQNCRDVLYDYGARCEYLRSAHHTEIQLVPRVGSSCGVVQIGVPLTRRSGHEQVNGTNALSPGPFRWSEPVALVSIKNALNLLLQDGMVIRFEVRLVNSQRFTGQVEGKADPEAQPRDPRSLPSAEAQSAASAKQIYK